MKRAMTEKWDSFFRITVGGLSVAVHIIYVVIPAKAGIHHKVDF